MTSWWGRQSSRIADCMDATPKLITNAFVGLLLGLFCSGLWFYAATESRQDDLTRTQAALVETWQLLREVQASTQRWEVTARYMEVSVTALHDAVMLLQDIQGTLVSAHPPMTPLSDYAILQRYLDADPAVVGTSNEP